MTTGKHTDLQTLQNPDGTFELVVAGDHGDDWSEAEEPRVAPTPLRRKLPWKPVLGVVAAAALVGSIAWSVVTQLNAGVSIDEEPLPVVTGFKPYLGGASAGLGAGAKRATSTRPALPTPGEDDEWADEEEGGREVVVERGEPAVPVPANEPAEVVEEAPVEEVAETHEAVPSVPTLPTDPQQIQRNLSRQLRTINGDRVNFPLAKPNLGGVISGQDMQQPEPVLEDPEGEPEEAPVEPLDEESPEPGE